MFPIFAELHQEKIMQRISSPQKCFEWDREMFSMSDAQFLHETQENLYCRVKNYTNHFTAIVVQLTGVNDMYSSWNEVYKNRCCMVVHERVNYNESRKRPPKYKIRIYLLNKTWWRNNNTWLFKHRQPLD